MKRLLVAIGILWLLGSPAVAAVGFQWAAAPDSDDAPLQIAIWYPSASTPALTTIGPFDMDVAMNGAVPKGRHPLIVMSHGTGGMALNSNDTAIALAEAGFVVVAVTHTGDNYRDHSVSFTRQLLVDRPRHIARVLDFMLNAWPGRTSIDPGRIGMFGHSAGGTTALIVAGGIADVDREVAFCQQNPDDWGCRRVKQRGPLAPDTKTGLATTGPIAEPDPRIKAVVLAAPAIANVFEPNGLAAVKVPVQLWVGAEDDIVRNGPLVRTLLPMQPDYHLIPHAGHFAYLTPCGELLARGAPDICTDPKSFDRAAFLKRFHRSVIAFYRARLKAPPT